MKREDIQDSPKCLGVITARGGSRRIPGKNMKPLAGTPLIGYVASAAIASVLDRVILSTDDDEIAAAVERYGVEVPFKRPASLSEDVPSEDVVLHALNWAETDGKTPYNVVVLLQPTTPFLLPDHINGCIRAMEESDINTCFTVRRVKEPPQWMFVENNDGTFEPFLDGPLEGVRGVFQSLPPYFLPNGGAYAIRTQALRKHQRIFNPPMKTLEMSHERSVDLDEPIDWVLAEVVAAENGFAIAPNE